MSTTSPQPLRRIGIAGNPNCGKTTLFNALTGLRHKVANYPGVTVEKKEGACELPGIGRVTIIDLPGTYSLSTHSIDEAIATKAVTGMLNNEPIPDLIISVIDAGNLERNLYLTTQLIDLGIPVIGALNMIDVANRRGIEIKRELLSRALGIPFYSLTACKGVGISELKAAIAGYLTTPPQITAGYQWLDKESPYREVALSVGSPHLSPHLPQQAALLIGSALLSHTIIPDTSTAQREVTDARQSLTALCIDASTFEATHRYAWINEIVQKAVVYRDPSRKSSSDKIDAVVTHKVWGSLILILVMGAVFQSIFAWASIPMEYIDSGITAFSAYLGGILPEGHFRSLIVDGVLPGVGSVVIFIPQIAILFFFLGVLEDSGYLSRAAFLMDTIMRKVGLQGRSFIPLLSSFACAIPGILSTRSIPSYADRMVTILVAPFMSCSARLPVYTLLIAACIPSTYLFGFLSLQALVLLGLYLAGIFGAALVALVWKKLLFRGEPALFVMEMPPYRLPNLKTISRDILDRILIFLQSAGTIILACSIILWALASFPQGDIRSSYAGQLGSFIEPAIAPLGFNWEIGISLFASFAAREVFVSSLATVYNIADGDDSSSQSLIAVLQHKTAEGTFSLATALSLMVFYVFACQCISTLAVCKRETNSLTWPTLMFFSMTAIAYGASYLTYHATLYFLK